MLNNGKKNDDSVTTKGQVWLLLKINDNNIDYTAL